MVIRLFNNKLFVFFITTHTHRNDVRLRIYTLSAYVEHKKKHQMRSNRNYYYTTERFFSFTFLFLHATHFVFQFRRDSRSVDFQPKHQIIVRRRYIICLLLLISSSADGFTRDHGRRSYGPPTILNVLSVIYGNPPLPPPPTKLSFVPEY